MFSQSGSLQGKITDEDTKEPIPFANVAVYSGGDLLTGTTTDFDGKYVIKPLTPGTYNLRASFVGYQAKEIAGVIVKGDQITFEDIALSVSAETLETVEVVEYKVPLISKDKTTSGATVTSEEIEKMPNRSATSIATTVGGVYSDADGDNISIRGQRGDGTVYYIDGMRVLGSSSLPESAIEQVSVILGGQPAKYGDATGGIISVTTKGPSREFGAGIEGRTSQFLDDFGYNYLSLNLQGPLVSKKENGNKTAVLGYFIAGDVVHREDGRPSATGTIQKITDDYLGYLKEEPQRPTGTGYGLFNNSLFTRIGDTETIDQTLNTGSTNVSLSGKLDLRTSPTVNVTLGGSFNLQDYRQFNYYGSLFNWENNAHVKNNTWRVFGRFTQRFPVGKESNSLIKNVFYSIQADYTEFYQEVEDDTHRDRLFNYGYLGKFETYKRRSYEQGTDTINGHIYTGWVQNAYQDTGYYFTAYDINPVVARYTEQYYDFYPDKGDWRNDPTAGYWLNYNQLRLYGGLLNGQSPDPVYSMWQNVGTQYNGYSVTDNSQIGITANASADIGNHAIEFGLQYEQRTNRYYGYGPVELWSLMRLITNTHINELDKSNPDLVTIDGVFQDTINYDRLYSFTDQRVFDINLRKAMGLDLQGTDWIDIDSYDPYTQTINYFDADGKLHRGVSVNGGLSVDMFSPDELLNSGISYVGYYGFDPYGNKHSNRPAFDDFFNKTDEILLPNGQRKMFNTRDIGAFEPIYVAGYIQDKFAFDDLIFNIGVRVDRFDANQMVLKDPYLFYSAYTAQEVNTINGQPVNHPGSISDEAVVYIDNKDNPTEILGYREGSTWYNASGDVITNPNILDAGNGITPYLTNPEQRTITADVFEDYEPQISVMPRISFSFPISEEALFFAHYDILTQRPTSALRMDPTSYLFIDQQGSINNPNLKPEKTIDYELGFQQKISNTSSLKISAFYREIRDQIQYFRYTGAYTGGSNLYDSYSNLDFATVKGLTTEYDLRRTNNVRARISYTLQFAEGTGSSPTTAAALVNAGLPNLRQIFPLNWDRRHSFNIVLDYRFGEGKNYNGPTSTRQIKGTDQVKTIQWLQNFGANLTLSGGSGTPYTRSENIVGVYAGGSGQILEGTINGSRLPWQFRIDGRVDKDIKISGDPKSNRYLNIYFQVLNVLNTQNIINVYSATGSPDDDGYLYAPEWQSNINSSIDPQAYRDLYALRMNSPFNFSTPRQIRLGVIFNF
ncbi:MAG: carboxypeptidase regulatory-like domain-containing protein [Bacteroidales bacterium]